MGVPPVTCREFFNAFDLTDEGFCLRCKPYLSFINRIIQRLDADRIARQEKLILIRNGQGEHAVQHFDYPGTELPI